MKSYYDKDSDSLGISLDSNHYDRTIELCAGVFIDVDKDNTPIGIEILNLKDFMKNKKYEIQLSMTINIPTRENPNSVRRELKPFLTKVKEVTGHELHIDKIEEIVTNNNEKMVIWQEDQ